MPGINRTITFLLAVITTFLFACAGEQVHAPEPVDEALDVCGRCHMAVKDNGYAAQVVIDGGKYIKFDDTGCLLNFLKDNAGQKVLARYVQDRNRREWIAFGKAVFVFAESVPTPMMSGIHAFKTPDEATAFIGENRSGKILSARELESLR